MKVSLNTAQFYAGDTQMQPNGVDALLSAIGTQLGAVEDVEFFGPKYDGIIVVRVVSCEKHPNADKLSVCRVDDGGAIKHAERGEDGLVQVVCGAPNVRADLLAAWIPPKATVPTTFGTNEAFVLEARELRGVISNGMLASASELGLSDNHDGLLEIEPNDDAKPGTPFKALYGLDDVVVDLENKMFTHRPDCFGVLGVARELAGIQGQTFKSPDWYTAVPLFEVEADSLPLQVQILDDEHVPRLMALAMSGLANGQSPIWMQAALSRMGIRPISLIVDITNFIMQLTGQPLHAYDYDKLVAISGDVPTLLARKATDKEQLELLSGKVLELGPDAVVIATDRQSIGLAGIMGGANTEVDGNTTRIVIEVASFDMYNIRRSCMKYGVFSDAATRFNKGQSALQNDKILRLAADMFAEYCGGKIASDVFDVQKNIRTFGTVTAGVEFINTRLGSKLSAEEIVAILNRTELGAVASGDSVMVSPPFWRTDIELAEDVVEEVGRLYGFDKLPVELPRHAAKAGTKDHGLAIKAQLRSILSSAGANEILTYNFVHGNLLDAFGQEREKALQLSNALSPDLQYYRMSLLPNVLDKIHANVKAGYNEFALFELGKTHNNYQLDSEDFDLPKESNVLALAYTADAKTAKQKRGVAYYQAQKYLDYVLGKLGITYTLKPLGDKITDNPVAASYDARRSAFVLSEQGEILGIIGEINPSATKKLKLPEYAAGFELDTDELVKLQKANSYTASSKYPKIEQDISLRVSADVSFASLIACLNRALAQLKAEDTVASFAPLDIYAAEAEPTKNMSFRLTIASLSRTLTASEVNELLDAIGNVAKTELSAERV